MKGHEGGGSDKSGRYWQVIRILSSRAPSFGIFSLRATGSAAMLPTTNFLASTITDTAGTVSSRWGQSLLHDRMPSIMDEVVGQTPRNGEVSPRVLLIKKQPGQEGHRCSFSMGTTSAWVHLSMLMDVIVGEAMLWSAPWPTIQRIEDANWYQATSESSREVPSLRSVVQRLSQGRAHNWYNICPPLLNPEWCQARRHYLSFLEEGSSYPIGLESWGCPLVL